MQTHYISRNMRKCLIVFGHCNIYSLTTNDMRGDVPIWREVKSFTPKNDNLVTFFPRYLSEVQSKFFMAAQHVHLLEGQHFQICG